MVTKKKAAARKKAAKTKPNTLFIEPKEVLIELGLTVNMGNFESAVVRVGLKADVPEDVSSLEVEAALSEHVLELMGQEAESFGLIAKKILRDIKKQRKGR